MMIIKSVLSDVLYGFLSIFAGEAFANRQFPLKTLLKHFFLQKILRINGHVPWPVHPTTVVKAPQNIIRGNRSPGLSPWCYLDGRNGIVIGNNTWIGPRVSIISMNHDVYDYRKYIKEEPIRIGNNCWIATGAIITAGVQLGDHTVVAAGSVVTKSFPGNVLIGGVPAKVIKKLENYGRQDS